MSSESISEHELQQAAALLAAEFPDTPRSVLESALRESFCDIPAARRKLLELKEDDKQRGGGRSASFRATPGSEPGESPSSSGVASWLGNGWNQGMRDLGLESLGAQLSLLGRQVAQGLNSILPADLNPFFDFDDEDEEELDPRVIAARGKERDKAAPQMVTGRLQNRNRTVSSPAASTKRFSSQDAEEEEEEEDYDKLN